MIIANCPASDGDGDFVYMGTMLYLSLSGAVSFCERDYSPFPLCGGTGFLCGITVQDRLHCECTAADEIEGI